MAIDRVVQRIRRCFGQVSSFQYARHDFPIKNIFSTNCLNSRGCSDYFPSLAVAFMLVGLVASLHAQDYNPNNYDAVRTIDEFQHPHSDLILLASHRGNHALVDGKYPGVPENSLESIGLAAQAKSEILELDVKLTQDGIPILSHDLNWGRENCGTFGNLVSNFNPFGSHFVNDSANPAVDSWTLSYMRGGFFSGVYTYLRDSISLTCNASNKGYYAPKAPTLQEALDFMTKNKIAMVLSLDIRDPKIASAAWAVVSKNSDYKGRNYILTTLFKVPAKWFATPRDVEITFPSGPGFYTPNFVPVYNTADIAPGAIVDTLFGGVDVGPGPSGYGSETAIIQSIKDFENDVNIHVAGVEVSVKQSGGILTDVLKAARTNFRTGQPMAVGIFSPFADYYAPSDPNRVDPLFFKTDGYCCVRLSDFYYNGGPNGQPSDTADSRSSLLYLSVQNFDFVTTDNPVSYDSQFAAVGKRVLSHIQNAGGTSGGGGSGKNLRILPLGDSITAGFGSTTWNGYRQNLEDTLKSAGNQVAYVGSLKHGTMPDNVNEGHSGWPLDAINGLTPRVGTCRPNVVTLMAGTNDAVQYRGYDPVARLEQVMRDIFTQDPNTSVVVAGLLPSTIAAEDAIDKQITAAIPGIVSRLQGEGKAVAYADMREVTLSDLSDQRHPNDGGYTKLAAAFANGIANLQKANQIHDPATVADNSDCRGGLQPANDPITPPAGTGTGTRTNAKLRLADFDGDGKADYIYMADNGAMTVWFNQGGGNWSPPKVVALGVAPGYQVQLADFNGDGKVDYIVVHDDGTVRVLLNKDGAGNWDDLGQVAFGEGPASEVRFADMDGDGKADYMIVGPGGSIDYWQNRGGDNRGGWGPDLHIAYGVAPSSEIQLVDFDGDGKGDYVVVAPDGSVQVWINRTGMGDPGGDWKWLHQVANGNLGFAGSNVLFADFDGDGRADYLGVGPGGALAAWLNIGGDNQAITGWSDLGTIAYGVGAPVSQIQFAKINSDKYADYLVVYPKTGAVDAYLSHGPQPKGTPWQWDKYAGIALGVPEFFPDDVIRFGNMHNNLGSGYGLSDYIVMHRNSSTETIAYFYLNGGGGVWSSSGQLAYLSPGSTDGFMPIVTDMTGDGKADLVYLYRSGAADGYINNDDFSKIPPSNQPKVDRSSSWGPRAAIATGVGPDSNHVVFGDLDGDHKSDYLTLSDDGRSVTFYRNSSGGGKWTWGAPVQIPGKVSCKVPKVTPTTSPSIGSNPDDVDPKIVLADVTGNDKADLLCVHPDGSVQAWQYLDGTQVAPANGWNSIGKIANGYLIPGLQ